MPGEIADESFILTGADEPDELTQFRLRHRLGRHVAGLSEHLEEARRLTMLGLGICFLPQEFAAPDVVEGRLHPLLPPFEDCTNQIYVITNPGTPGVPCQGPVSERTARGLNPAARPLSEPGSHKSITTINALH